MPLQFNDFFIFSFIVKNRKKNLSKGLVFRKDTLTVNAHWCENGGVL